MKKSNNTNITIINITKSKRNFTSSKLVKKVVNLDKSVIENNLNNLKEIVSKLDLAKNNIDNYAKEYKDLYTLFNSETSKFLKKHHILDSRTKFNNKLLGRYLDESTLKNHLLAKGEIKDVIKLLSELHNINNDKLNLKNYEDNSYIYDFANEFNTNLNKINWLIKRLEEKDSIEYNSDKINLNIGDLPLMDNNMYENLKSKIKVEDQILKNSKNDKSMFYVLIFNRIKHDSKYVLTYHYIKYHISFLRLFYAYAEHQQSSLTRKHENISTAYDYFFVFDSELTNNYAIDLYNFPKSYYDNKAYIHDTFYIDHLKDMTNNTLISLNYEKQAKLIYSLFKNELDTANKILFTGARTDYLEDFSSFINVPNNLLSRFFFVSSNLQQLRNIICTEYEKSINEGSQKFRGQVNNSTFRLHRIDQDFRDAMYHYNKTFFEIDALNKEKFKYANIHINYLYKIINN